MNYLSKLAIDFGIEIIKCGPIPKHVAFICDGNRRYAKEKGISKREGWLKGTELAFFLLDICEKLGIKELSFFLFGIENLKRSKDELDTLLEIFKEMFHRIPESEKIRIWIKGAIELAPEDIQILSGKLFEKSSKKKQAVLDVNWNVFYSSMFEFSNSIDSLFELIKIGEIEIDELNMSHFETCLWNNLNSVDLLIRTSGEIRFSDYLLWQSNYAHLSLNLEFNWPEINFIKFSKIILNYQTQSIQKTRNNDPKENISSKFQKIISEKEVERFREFLKNPICKFDEKFKF